MTIDPRPSSTSSAIPVGRERLTVLLDLLADPALLVSTDGIVLHGNAAAFRTLGLKDEGKTERRLAPILEGALLDPLPGLLSPPRAGVASDLVLRTGAGMRVAIDLHVIPAPADTGTDFVCVLRPAGPNEATTLELRRVKEMIEATSDWFWEADDEHRLTYHADRFFQPVGRDSAVLIGTTREDIADPSDIERHPEKWELYRNDIACRRPFRDLTYHRGSNNRYIQTSGRPLFTQTGRFLGYCGVSRDVTETILAMQREEERRARIEEAIDGLSEGISLWSPDDRLILMNARAKAILSAIDDLIEPGAHFDDLVRALIRRGAFNVSQKGPPTQEEEEEYFTQRKALRKKDIAVIERRLANGLWLLVREQRLKDGHVVTVYSDITELKQRQLELADLAARNAQLATAVAAAKIGIVIADARRQDAPVVFANDAFLALTGYGLDEVKGRSLSLLFGPETDGESIRRIEEAVRTGQAANVELISYRKDGTPYWGELSLSPVPADRVPMEQSGNGQPPGHGGSGAPPAFCVGFHADITSRKKAEQELNVRARQQAAVAALGRLALSGADMDSLMEDAVMLVASTLDVEFASINKLLPEEDGFIIRAATGWDDSLIGTERIKTGAESHSGYTLLTAQPVIIEDLSTEIRFRSEFLRKAGIVSGLSVAIFGRDSPFGVINAHTTRRRTFTSYDTNFLQSMANVLAAALERKRAEQALRLSEERFDLAVKGSNDGLWDWDLVTDRMYLSPRLRAILGIEGEESSGQALEWFDRIHPEDAPLLKREIQQHLRGETPYLASEHRVQGGDGRYVWVLTRGLAVRHPDGQPYRMAGSLSDITERKRAEDALRESETRYRTLFTEMSEGFALCETVYDETGNAVDIRIIEANPAAGRIAGMPPEMLRGRTARELFPHMDQQSIDVFNSTTRTGEPIHIERYSSVIDRWLESYTFVLGDGRFGQFFHDITERKRAEEQLLHDAFHDALTGLPNRALFLDRLEQAMVRARRAQAWRFAVLFLDFDRFKVVNDSLGHALGDRMLTEIGRRLQDCLRSVDTVARLSGDEFVILLEDLDGVEQAGEVAERVKETIATPFHIDGHEIFSSVSVGIAMGDRFYQDPAEIVRDADIAMYQAKARGRATHVVFDRGMHVRAVGLLQLETDLRHALDRSELRLHFQPIVSLSGRRVVGFEALLRWQHPERGLVTPADFIPIAEETGLIGPIGRWVLSEACRQVVEWRAAFAEHGDLSVSVNLSPRQLGENGLVEFIEETLRSTGLPSQRLNLELTEGAIMANPVEVASRLLLLKSLGVQIHVDDFGTGYSSLSHLHRFPIDALKIDRSFVSQMSHTNENLEIVRTIIALARSLRMEAVAEGVETKGDAALLEGMGCGYGQGYLFARPLPSDQVEVLLKAKAAS